MAVTATRIPLVPYAQILTLTLADTVYSLRLTFNTQGEGGWILDIADANRAVLLAGLPLVTGADLLAQHRHIGIGGALFVTTDRNTGDVPTYDGLGTTSQLTFVPYA